jgi:2-polyprenyl-6-methoxyphenol hydroxylase-like FAD-dependent oxidoreductase
LPARASIQLFETAGEPLKPAEYDYVVVGAGSAGAVVAARLSEDPATRVLLLEAGGPDRNVWIHVPLGVGKLLTDPRFVWPYFTHKGAAPADHAVYWPKGRVADQGMLPQLAGECNCRWGVGIAGRLLLAAFGCPHC